MARLTPLNRTFIVEGLRPVERPSFVTEGSPLSHRRHSPQPKPLVVGALAPDCEWVAADGRTMSLQEFQGQPVLLAFFRKEGDHTQVRGLSLYNQVLQRIHGAQVLGISQDDFWCEVTVHGGDALRFPLLQGLFSDTQIAQRFGVAGLHAVFLIDASGVIRWRYVAQPGLRASVDELFDAVAESAPVRHISRREFGPAPGTAYITR